MTLLRGTWRIRLALGALALFCLLACSPRAAAKDLTTALNAAESRAAAAATQTEELEAALAPAERRSKASAGLMVPARAAAREADRRVTRTEEQLRDDHLAAAARLSRIEEERRDAADKHDGKVRAGIGLALAALVAAGIAVAWGWFRASALVAWLTRISLAQAVGICAGGGLLTVIVGAAMSGAPGVIGAVGFTLFMLGFVLANALVLARHSAEVQRGRAKPILRRERLPRRVAQVIAGAFAAFCLIALGTAVFAGETESSAASAALRREAGGGEMSTPALIRAKKRAQRLDRRAASLIAAARADQRDLQAVRRKLHDAEARLASAESEASSLTHRLAALVSREEREAEAEVRRAEERAEEEAEEAEELAAEECDPNYSGCLDPNAADYDCAGGSGDGPLYTGTVEVLGVDHYGLDEDGDGIGCDS